MEDLIKKIDEWNELDEAKKKADDHTRCPRCREQLYFCDCCAVLADEILIDHHEWIRKKAEEE